MAESLPLPLALRLASAGIGVAAAIVAVSVVGTHMSKAADARDAVVIPYPPSPPMHPDPPTPPPSHPPSPPPSHPPPTSRRRLFQRPEPEFQFDLKGVEVAHLKLTVLR